MRVTFLMFFYYTDLMGYFFRLINRDFNTLWRLPRKRRAVIVYCQLAVLYLVYTKPVYLYTNGLWMEINSVQHTHISIAKGLAHFVVLYE